MATAACTPRACTRARGRHSLCANATCVCRPGFAVLDGLCRDPRCGGLADCLRCVGAACLECAAHRFLDPGDGARCVRRCRSDAYALRLRGAGGGHRRCLPRGPPPPPGRLDASEAAVLGVCAALLAAVGVACLLALRRRRPRAGEASDIDPGEAATQVQLLWHRAVAWRLDPGLMAALAVLRPHTGRLAAMRAEWERRGAPGPEWGAAGGAAQAAPTLARVIRALAASEDDLGARLAVSVAEAEWASRALRRWLSLRLPTPPPDGGEERGGDENSLETRLVDQDGP